MSEFMPAHATWYTFRGQGGNFSVYSFTGEEAVNKPYTFSIELVSRSANEDINSLLGTEALLTIPDKSGQARYVHGLICDFAQGHSAKTFTHYRCTLVPRLWFLDKIRDHRIFQQLSIDKIITKILQEQGFGSEGFEFKLSKSYDPRGYCAQYGETDLHFISRLCEEEGIYFYFEHSESGHKLCFCDREGGPKISGESSLRFYSGSGQVPTTAFINRLELKNQVNSNAATYREWNFEKPKLNLEVERVSDEAPVPKGMLLEQYKYPHIYQLQASGTNYAEVQLLRQSSFLSWIELTSDVSRFMPSFTFNIYEHKREDINVGWWTVAVHHIGEQPGVLEHEAPEGRGQYYQSNVVAIPEMTRFVPPTEHPKSLVPGQQTAIVTGPEGEEIFTDKHGRVKVQFFWDRADQWNDKTTCWIRVSQGWAGSSYGAMAIPRIGHEVIVSFLEGNPDRPIITGRVYHELNIPPYPLPEHKTRTVFKSMSTPGKENEERGFNEFRIEDKAGEEEIFVHAEKDANIHVKNDWKERILHDRHQTVENFTYLETGGETHETLHGQRKTELFANDNLTVYADSHTKVDGKMLGKVGTELHIKAGQKVIIEAGTELTVRGGAGWMKLDPSGVRFGGPKINLGGGGSPGTGTGANPLLPDDSKVAPPPPAPIFVETLRKASANAAGVCEICQAQGNA